MAAATDEAGIQFRILNSSKGPAVRATRAQADRVLYKAAIRRRLENQPNLWLFQQAVDDLIVAGDRVAGVITQLGITFRGKTVVLTAGTFLDGKIHVGLSNYPAGRAGDPPALSLSARLKELKLLPKSERWLERLIPRSLRLVQFAVILLMFHALSQMSVWAHYQILFMHQEIRKKQLKS